MNRFLFISLIFISLGNIFAQTPIQPDEKTGKVKDTATVDCKPAKDSLKNRMMRGEISYYSKMQYQFEQYNFITIDKKRYLKTEYPKGYPSISFVSCYNKEVKKVLDSIYRLDFFKHEDSILHSYDKKGKGYRVADFPGGAVALQKFMDTHVEIPKDSKPEDGGNTIRIYYSFIVDEKGNISDYKLVKSNCKACEEPVLSAIKKIPVFTPAVDGGTPKKIRYVLPYTRT
jgi:hypothetical protein